MAHPDDAELWAGGMLALHAQTGAAVTEPQRTAQALLAALPEVVIAPVTPAVMAVPCTGR